MRFSSNSRPGSACSGRHRVVLCALLLAGPACSLVDGSNTLDSFDQIQMLDADDGRAWPDDDFSLIAAEILGDSLRVEVRYSGGCEDHEFRLVAREIWAESEPVQLSALLTHDDRDDACDAIVGERLRFDLVPAAQAWDRAYTRADPPSPPRHFWLRVMQPDSTLAMLLYEF